MDTGDDGGEVVSYRIVVRDGAGQVSEDEVLDGDPERCGEFTCRFTIADLEADVPYTVLVTAKDSAVDLAHESEAANALFFVDTKVPDDPPPGIPDLVRVDQRDISFDATISWAQAGDPDFPEKGSGVLFYDISLSPGGFTGRTDHADCSAGECEVIIRGLTDGTYGVEVEAVDRALNASAPTTGNIPIGDPAKPQGLTVKPTPGSQLALFARYSYHAFITDRDGETLELKADHRRHAEVENAIRDLKYGVGLNHMPSGRFAANGAWLAGQVMAHNLARWTARIGLGERTMITKTLRRRVFALVGRITRSARRLTLHLPRRWPWETQFSRALARLQAIPFPA